MSIGHILLIHPEGNFTNNPGLSGMIEILCEQDYEITVIAPNQNFYQDVICSNMHLQLVSRNLSKRTLHGDFLFHNRNFTTFEPLKQFVVDNFAQFDLIIAVDRGVIEAAKIAGILNVPYGLISFEITFAEETSLQYKEPEKEACQGLAFAICQDQLRSERLSEENAIPMKKIIQVPLCGRGIRRTVKTYRLHDQFGLSHNTKILLNMGSLCNWSMVHYILENAHSLPDNWVLIIHNRYGRTQIINQLHEKSANLDNVYFTEKSFSTHTDLSVLLGDVDAGIALYAPQAGNLWAGNNLKYIGLASGKISTYLQHGIPVIINDTGEMGNLVQRYNLGCVVDTSKSMNENSIPIDKFKDLRENCFSFIEGRFDLDKTIEPFLAKLKELFAVQTKDVIQQYFKDASDSLNAGNLEAAIESYTNIVAINPYSFQSNYFLGEFYRITGDTKKAVHCYIDCLKINSVDRNVITRLREILRNTNMSYLRDQLVENYMKAFPDDTYFREEMSK